MLKYKYIFQTKYTETVLSNSTRKLLRFEIISKMLIAVKNKLIVLFVIIFGMRSFRIRRLRLWCYAMQPRNHSLVISWRLPSWLTFITCTDRPIDLRVMCADELIIGSICLSLMARSHYAAEVWTLQMVWTDRSMHTQHNGAHHCLCTRSEMPDSQPATSAGFWVRGSMPPAAWGGENLENLTTKWCILKYIWINMWSA